jgi:hypothetical protein
MKILLILGWLGCSWVAFSSLITYYQQNWVSIAYKDRASDTICAGMLSIGGPIFLLMYALMRTMGYYKGITPMFSIWPQYVTAKEVWRYRYDQYPLITPDTVEEWLKQKDK